MPNTLADMTPEDFERLLETVVERKLRDVLGLPDEEVLDPVFSARLVAQREAVASGERGVSLADALRELDAG